MKKLTILFLALTLFAVGCANKVTSNNTDTHTQAYTTQIPAGEGDSSANGIAEFLKNADYQGVYSTEAGFGGYKIKDGKIYTVEKVNETQEKWAEIKGNIQVSKSLNKLQYQTERYGLEIITFDGFGYHSYSQEDGGLPKYYKKYDYLEKYAGTYSNDSTTDTKKVDKITIYDDGCITRWSKSNSWGCYTTQVILEDNKLTFKGIERDTITFNADGSATYTYSDGKSDKLTKIQVK
jgi:hypothetical protein